MRPCLAIFWLIVVFPVALLAQDKSAQVPLWQNGAPGFESRKDEAEVVDGGGIRNIHNPSITAFLPPAEKANGAAIVICPGGALREIGFIGEGVPAAEFMSGIGVAAFVLKYRLPREANSPYDIKKHPREDGQRAIRLIRSRAKEWNIDISRVGLLGFSAGGEVASMVACHSGTGDPAATDPIDRLAGRPNFQALVYPGPLAIPEKVPATVPPTFLIVANDDSAAKIAVNILQKYQAANHPIEAHFLAKGGHAFGIGAHSRIPAIKGWPELLVRWMDENYLLDPAKREEDKRRALEAEKTRKKSR